MNVLVACEESQRVCVEFRNRGHRAFSCDIMECSGDHPEWHIMQDVLPLLNGNCTFRDMRGGWHEQTGKWDLIIAFPPCTHIAVSGAEWFDLKRGDGRQREAIEFFCKFLWAECDKIAIENPIGVISGNYIRTWFPDLAEKYRLPRNPTQIIQPWMFGDNHAKSTCLWLKGLNELEPEITRKPKLEYHVWTDGKTGEKKRQPKWYYEALYLSPKQRAIARSRTFPGIARAMAEQWGDPAFEQLYFTDDDFKKGE